MNRLAHLSCSTLIIVAAAYPLFDIIQTFGEIEHKVSVLAIGLILIWLVLILFGGALWFYSTWMDITEEKEE